MTEMLTALGLMSGTSLDGIDAAIIHTDGERVEITSQFLTVPYEDGFQEKLRHLCRTQDKDSAPAIEKELTIRHADAVEKLLKQARLKPKDIDVIGFHGQTIGHAPERGFTWQIGDGALLASLTGIGVVNDFRSGDVAAGGQGAPLVPLFHAALVKDIPKPVAVLNIGGVANVTYISDEDILAFDTGPGNALINDWVLHKAELAYDDGGGLAAMGRANTNVISEWLKAPYFSKPFPKSLDRNSFSTEAIHGFTTEDGAATLTAFTVAAIAQGAKLFPKPARAWYVCGGGRHNREIMRGLRNHLAADVQIIEKLGMNGDAIEAEAFAFLAVRSLKGMELTLPRTTGRPQASRPSGGVFYPAGTPRAS